MWNLVRTMIIALAFAGFIGQSTARATPLPVIAHAVEMSPDCAEMMIEQAAPSDPGHMPCENMTPECIAQMGCAAVSPVLTPALALSRPSEGATASYDRVTTRLDGTAPSPLRGPPRLQL